REQALSASEKIQGHLMGRLSVTIANGPEHHSLFAGWCRKIALPEWRIGDHCNVLRFAVGQDMILDSARSQVVDHLITHNLFARQRLLRLFQMIDIEVTDADVTNFSRRDELFHGT